MPQKSSWTNANSSSFQPLARQTRQPRKPYERFREKQFVCDLCVTLKQNVQQHIVNFHGLDRSSPDRESFERRMRRFQCMKCLKIFKSEDVALKHFEKAHDKPVKMEKKEHKCDCEKVYLTKTQLEEHVSIVHLNVRKFICTQCPASFGRRGGLRRHVEMVHVRRQDVQVHLRRMRAPGIQVLQGPRRPRPRCSHGRASLRVLPVRACLRPQERLEGAEATHSRIVDLRCQYCGAAFRRDNYLKKHYRVCEKKNRRRIAPGKEPRNRSPKKEEPASEENAALARERVYEGMTLRAKPRRRVIY
ncbi:hypothetical protein L596_026513 [Steinernema carpocapsae]|uniref:C2H2-type domain-containing protein n=1 Tax=Steinernema carpocapsae TaxID=34508 RepID=A0A4U5M1L5_STECR|nr:hypothetical protein L596_026513 [Steinernema carpocapsae]